MTPFLNTANIFRFESILANSHSTTLGGSGNSNNDNHKNAKDKLKPTFRHHDTEIPMGNKELMIIC